jgi:hypothetical protein
MAGRRVSDVTRIPAGFHVLKREIEVGLCTWCFREAEKGCKSCRTRDTGSAARR